MATFSRVSPTGWNQGDDTNTFARVSPTGWSQVLVTLYGPYVEPGYVLPDYVFSYNLARPIADVSNSGWRGVLV